MDPDGEKGADDGAGSPEPPVLSMDNGSGTGLAEGTTEDPMAAAAEGYEIIPPSQHGPSSESPDDTGTIRDNQQGSSDGSVSSDAESEAQVDPDQILAAGSERTEQNSTNGPTMPQLAADLLQQYDPSRMQLTREELEWALNIKHAIESIPDLDNLSDLWYAQLAIVTEGNLEVAVSRAYRLQEHKKSNNIMDTLDDGLRNLPKEESFLSIDYNLHTDGYIVAYDATKANGNIWTNPAERCYYNRRSFYCSQMANCDLAALRAGMTILVECEGYRLVKGKSMDLKAYSAIWNGAYAYPKRLRQVKFFNNASIFNVMMAMAKSTLPKDITSKFHVDARCPMGRLDNLYNLPYPEVAKARLQNRMKDLLARRFANEMFFKLQEPAPSPVVAPPLDTNNEVS